jgi:glycyl-tRNA synthetase beta chain
MDNRGQLNERGLKFIEAKGIDKNNIKFIETSKGKYLGGVILEHKLNTKNILLDNLPNIIINIPFPKTMKWDDSNIRFARPIRWILSIFNGETMRFTLGNLEINNYTYGHRFMVPGKILIKNNVEYGNALKKAFVIVDKSERQQIIKNYIEDISKKNNLSFNIDLDLLNTVSNLVEYPYPIVATFDNKFLELPAEVLITSMKNHQKFFYLKDKNNNITNTFIGVSNTKPIDENVVAKGYARVLKARLTDALFFFNNDKKMPLMSRLDKLKNIIFQERLGSMYDKTERLKNISVYISNELGYKDNKQKIERIATLSKCDLLTEMVMEFPELQGIMGKIYASIQEEDPLVANGIYEHYLPRFAEDELPESLEGAIVSMADKLDTITGNFAIGNTPSGNIDPYGLRRKAIGIIEILNKHNFDPYLDRIVTFTLDLYKITLNFDYVSISENIISFIKLRLKQMLSNNGVSPDIFEAVVGQYNRILLLKKAAYALNKFKSTDNFKNVALSYKRTNNILQKSNLLNRISSINKNLIKNNYELNLCQMIENNMKGIPKKLDEERFDEIFQNIANFSEPLNKFFDNVMVMDEDEQIRINRLALLLSLKKCFNMACDLSKLIY